MVILALFIFIFGAILSLLVYSDRAWRTGRDKITEQQETRKAADNIAYFLRQSSPEWTIEGDPNTYPVSITSGNDLSFYQPIFDSDGNITILRRIRYYLDPLDNTRILRQIGAGTPVPLANDISNLAFTFPTTDHAQVNLSIASDVGSGYTVVSQITMRNQNTTLPSNPLVTVEEPEGGEEQ